MNDLDGLGYRGSTTVVTGCASGMGAATAQLLSDLGAKVHAIDIREPVVPHETWHPTDLADPAQIDSTDDALEGIGPIDTLFNCAGVPYTVGPLGCVAINYIGTRYLTDRLVPLLADGGAIATIASDAGMGWQQNLPAINELLAIDDPHEALRWCERNPDAVRFDGYGFSKELLVVWTMRSSVSLARERRIRTNCIGPCPTDTAFMASTIEATGKEYFERFPYPLFGRMATPEEQAWPLVLLNSSRNAVVTGAVLYTDQGFAGGIYTGEIDPVVLALDDPPER